MVPIKNKILILKIFLSGICILFLAVTFHTENRSSGWVQQTIPRPDLAISDLQFVDSLTGFIVQSRINPDTSFISKTTDGGNNWITTQFNDFFLTSLKFVDENTGYCVGQVITSGVPGVVEKTTNAGQNWFTISTVTDFIYLTDVFFPNKDTGWVCSTDIISGGLWRTINGGLNWQLQLDYNVRPSKIFFINSNTGWVIKNTGYLYKTTNCGTNWFLQQNFGNTTADVFFSTPDTGWIIGGGGQGILKSVNGGINWNSVNNPPLGAESRLFFIDNSKGWVGSLFHKIFITKNGYDFGTQYSPSNRSDNIWMVDSLHGWAGYEGLVHTVDGGGPITYIGLKRNGEFVPSFELGQNYPNPFNPTTKIKFSILKSCTIELRVFDITAERLQNRYRDKNMASEIT